MYCYFCEQHHPGGPSYGHYFAHGICQNCGVGVCLKHSHKESKPGAPLLCFECASLLTGDRAVAKIPEMAPDFEFSLN